MEGKRITRYKVQEIINEVIEETAELLIKSLHITYTFSPEAEIIGGSERPGVLLKLIGVPNVVPSSVLFTSHIVEPRVFCALPILQVRQDLDLLNFYLVSFAT